MLKQYELNPSWLTNIVSHRIRWFPDVQLRTPLMMPWYMIMQSKILLNKLWWKQIRWCIWRRQSLGEMVIKTTNILGDGDGKKFACDNYQFITMQGVSIQELGYGILWNSGGKPSMLLSELQVSCFWGKQLHLYFGQLCNSRVRWT